MLFLKPYYILFAFFIFSSEVLANYVTGGSRYTETETETETERLKEETHRHHEFDDGIKKEDRDVETINSVQAREMPQTPSNRNNENAAEDENESNSDVTGNKRTDSPSNDVGTPHPSNELNSTSITLIVLLVLVLSLTLAIGVFYFRLTETFQLWKKYCRRQYRELVGHRNSMYQQGGSNRMGSFRGRLMSSKLGRYGSWLLRGPPRNCQKNRPVIIQPPELGILKERTTAVIGLRSEFQDINLLSSYHKATTHAQKSGNISKNRYTNILPYDHSRVELSILNEDKYSGYINASYIPGFGSEKEYIAAQGPLVGTVSDFWRMIWEQDVSLVVMLTQVEEQGRLKCAQYWPLDEQDLTFGSITISLVEQAELTNYVLRDLEIERDGHKRSIKHIEFLGWPDFGCPRNPETLLSFVAEVRRLISSQSNTAPILVHCSAGVGRTGTFIALDCILQEVKEKSEIDVFGTVLKLRENRMCLVQTEAQYRFLYHCLLNFCQEIQDASVTESGSQLTPDLRGNESHENIEVPIKIPVRASVIEG